MYFVLVRQTELLRNVKLHICCWDIFHWFRGVKLENFCELFIRKMWLCPISRFSYCRIDWERFDIDRRNLYFGTYENESTLTTYTLMSFYFWHLYVLWLLHYRMMLRTAKSDCDVRTRSTGFRVDLGTRYVTICLVSLVAWRSGEKRYTMKRMERWLWAGGVGKEWTEKESFQQYFYNRYKILHICHTYCCYAYHFYAYWL
jgi:hypothetical protein